ncbi:hypothetical protein K227x_17140 [Rubripirellula lacrimiformis]|uniref:Uncharacterized protein n=1 Tax=Rubripirellula lacrimiformis TaxID=1930273 RepID=A0A517N879_9BACT|nr:hypothetical protein K227x_17140 [Rubripirellula lacrimiformis]
MQSESTHQMSKAIETVCESSVRPRFVVPVFETAILVGSVAFLLGIVIPFVYAHEFMRPHLAPLPGYLQWIDAYDHRLLGCASIAVPALILICRFVAKGMLPNRILASFPWWSKSLQEVLREHRKECDA